MKKSLQGSFDPCTLHFHPCFDLWLQAAHLLLTRQPGQVSITKIKSHQRWDTLVHPLEQREARGNDDADCLAKAALQDHGATNMQQDANWKL